jgi:hypothetical protein
MTVSTFARRQQRFRGQPIFLGNVEKRFRCRLVCHAGSPLMTLMMLATSHHQGLAFEALVTGPGEVLVREE